MMTSSGRYVSTLPDHVLTITRFYCPHGPVRVQVQSNKAQTKIPTVRQLVASMTKKYEQDSPASSSKERRNSGAFTGCRVKSAKTRRVFSSHAKRRSSHPQTLRHAKSAGHESRKGPMPTIQVDPPSEDDGDISPTCDEDTKFLHPARRTRSVGSVVEVFPPRVELEDQGDCSLTDVSRVLTESSVSETSQGLSDCEGQCSVPNVAGNDADDPSDDETKTPVRETNFSHDGTDDDPATNHSTRRHSIVNVSETALVEETTYCRPVVHNSRISSSNSIQRTTVRRFTAAKPSGVNLRNDSRIRTVRLPANIRVGIYCQATAAGEASGDGKDRHFSSTASTTIQPYQTSDYVSFTSNSDLSARDRAPPTGLSDELQYRNSLPEPVNEHVLLERKRGNHGRSNSLHTQQLRALKQDKVSRLNSVEPSSSYSPIERETIQTREKDSQTLNERVQIPSTQEREKAQFKQNYFKPIGARNTNSYTVANNQAVLHQRTATQNGRDSDENIVAMGTLVGSSNAGTSPALKSSRSSSGSTGGGQQTHINVQSTSNPQQAAHLNQGSSGVNLNVRKFNSRFGQSNQSPYFNTGHSLSKQRDEEPRYPDPLNGAPSSFQQRVAELASLEADTIRHERAKKLKKRNKES